MHTLFMIHFPPYTPGAPLPPTQTPYICVICTTIGVLHFINQNQKTGRRCSAGDRQTDAQTVDTGEPKLKDRGLLYYS